MSYHLDLPGLAPYIPQLLTGAWTTIQLTVISTLGGLILGTLCAAGRTHRQRWLRWLCASYVEVIRNTPFIVQLFFIFFGLPAIGLKLTAWQAGSIAMVINLGAYSAEIIRAGIDAAPKGQWEAGKVLGLTTRQTFMHVILPPAYQRVYPALTSQCIIVMLGSAVVSQISVEELTFAANFAQSRSFLSFEAYLVTAIIYLVLSMLMRQTFAMVKQYSFKNPSL
ncbi:polar amino acid ABC transporter permease [Vibrio sp. 10N.286.49.C2]|uniref:amino acid ABC transporter permease n=1 Tax=unclassified Vibrio TaxID=2614977 RepID=UPI000C816494|nr:MULTISPECIES: amino acid ABC transporter permease [unclassified Vibrio]PMH42940.1 polar amino acid ABC transporter permease [Vibrio sp. 10N.286.49.C2]PMH53721.1 polar amino acid ABC transporter permease [Vibrio sp. 10N.286.49.B1]PMH82464.1 polar amino acid ABC transporter permease [Vibrio sp. 10N.286.48.B7]